MSSIDTTNRPGKPGVILGIAVFTASLFMVEHAISMVTTPLDFSTEDAAPGTFPDTWIHGSKSAMDNEDPAVQVHAYNDHTYILRENKAINYEGAFM